MVRVLFLAEVFLLEPARPGSSAVMLCTVFLLPPALSVAKCT